MKKTNYYTYLGTNGVITSPVFLENIYCIKKYFIEADSGKLLTTDGKIFCKSATIPTDELSSWYEITDFGQNDS